MKQSTVIFGALIFAFFVYITMRGQLPRYRALFTRNGNATTPSVANTQPVSTPIIPLEPLYDFNALNIWNNGDN